jgi:hypothetical protein
MPHRKCRFVEEDCTFIASFGFRDGCGTQFCSKHKQENMINLLCKLCNCGKSRPTYNYEGLSANFCKECKESDMINVNDKKCFCGRVKPTFNLAGLLPKFCAKCKTEEMIDVYSKQCKCEKSSKPCFNYEGLKAEYCSKCKLENMIDVTHNRCKCGKVQPGFNYIGLKAEYCKECKLEGMILINKRTCIQCSNQATYNLFGLKPEYCNKCRTDDMINVVDKCKNDTCVNTGSIKYKYYCTFCFQHLFPDDPATSQIRKKTKENYVRDFLKNNFDNFLHDIPLWTGNCDCSHRRRIDHRLLVGNTLLCIETDENQHKKYNKEDEELRYDDLYMIHGGKFIFIRFNPDKYRNNLETSVNPCMKRRMPELKEEIEKQVERIKKDENNDLLEIIYLFYDGYN